MKKTIYLSGPIGDHDLTTEEGQRTLEERRKAFAEYEAKIKALGHHVINPFDIYEEAKTHFQREPTRHEIMQCDLLVLLRDADELWLMPNWNKSHGCTVEIIMAAEAGIPVKDIQTQKALVNIKVRTEVGFMPSECKKEENSPA